MTKSHKNNASKYNVIGEGYEYLAAAIVLQAWVDWTHAHKQIRARKKETKLEGTHTIVEIRRFLQTDYFDFLVGDGAQYLRERFAEYERNPERMGCIPRLCDLQTRRSATPRD